MATDGRTETKQQRNEEGEGPKYYLDIEGERVAWDDDTITTEEIIELGGWNGHRGCGRSALEH